MWPIFRNGYGLNQLRERLLLKESYTTSYHLLRTGKLPQKIILRKLQALSVQWLLWDCLSSSLRGGGGMVEIWQKVKICSKCSLMTSPTWLINVYIHSHTRKWFFKYYLQKCKVTSNFIFKPQGDFLVKVSLITYYNFRKGKGIFFIIIFRQ